MKTRLIDLHGIRLPKDAVYIGRRIRRKWKNGDVEILPESIFHNPFKGKDALFFFDGHAKGRCMSDFEWYTALKALKGKTVACWCVTCEGECETCETKYICHGCVLIELLEAKCQS